MNFAERTQLTRKLKKEKNMRFNVFHHLICYFNVPFKVEKKTEKNNKKSIKFMVHLSIYTLLI